MILIKWLGDDRFIPAHGSVTKGCTLSLPKDIADKLVSQGQAQIVRTERPTKQLEED